jgi:type IV secretory pathway VirD2 relaxase
MYAKNTVAGQWRAHGCYGAHESATREGDTKAVGFDGRGESINIAERLESWQKAGDERLWKLIVSPEFGDRADLKRLTRDLVSRMEKDFAMQLEWVAVAHYNTDDPHVHMALRGIDAEGRPLHLSRDYIKQGIREIAENLCTRQLGHRTELDAAVAQRREVHQHCYTSLDRIIKRVSAIAVRADEENRVAALTKANPLPQNRFAMNHRHASSQAGLDNGSGLVAVETSSVWFTCRMVAEHGTLPL